MKNNLTEKEINNLYNWAKEYGIKELQTKDRKKLLNIKKLTVAREIKNKKDASYIPNEFFKLVNLKKLYILLRNLKVLPKDIGNLINLEELNIGWVAGCKLIKLPKEIGNLTKLKKLIIWCEELKELPKEICNLTNLKEFLIHSEKLEELPREIGDLVSLEELTIGCDKLERLPK